MFFGEEEMKNTGVNVFFAKGLKTHERALLQDLHEVKIKLKYNCKYSKSLSNHYLKILEMSRMLSNSKTFVNCCMDLKMLVMMITILKNYDEELQLIEDDETNMFTTLSSDDGVHWIDDDILLEVYFLMGRCKGFHQSLDLLNSVDKKLVFLVLSLILRYFYTNRNAQQIFIEYYENITSPSACTDQYRIEIGETFQHINTAIEECQEHLFGEDETIMFTLVDDKLHFGSQIRMQPQFALNVGVEKSRIKTLNRQAVLKAERERQRLEDEALMKVIEEAKPEKVSKQSQTKSANKKKEQEKKEREEYEKRCALAEAERQRQLKKKQEQKKAKKSK